MFKYTSETFTTGKKMEEEKKKLIKEICNHFGVERSQLRLHLGSIKLQGNYNGNWINLTSTIGDFKQKIKEKNYPSFRLHTKLVTDK